MANITLSWDFDSNIGDEFAICRDTAPFELNSIDDVESKLIAKIPLSAREFVDSVIESNTTYFYSVATMLGKSFKASSQLEIKSGDEGGSPTLTWSPEELDCLILLTSEGVTEEAGQISKWTSKTKSSVFDFNKLSRGSAKLVDTSTIKIEGSSFRNATAGKILNGAEHTTAFILARDTNARWLGGGANAACYLFIPYISENRNSFTLYQQLSSQALETYIRNRPTSGESSEYLFNEVLQPPVLSNWVCATMFANWAISDVGASQTFLGQTYSKSTSFNKPAKRYPGGNIMRIGGANNINSQTINAEYKCVVVLNEPHSDALQQILEGWAAWKFNMLDILPANHRYKNVPPQKGEIVRSFNAKN